MFAVSMDFNTKYSVKKFALLAGISIRTLHLYDEMGLLKPSSRSEAGYRHYGEKELLRLQQILFYKELGIPLKEIATILDQDGFDMIAALEQHKQVLKDKFLHISELLQTIDKTIQYIKGEKNMTHEELYEGLPKEEARAMKQEAIEKWGEESIAHSEKQLLKLSKDQIAALRKEQMDNMAELASLVHLPPESKEVKDQIARHYKIIRTFWGTDNSPDKQGEAYSGLGMLYMEDERYTMVDGKHNADFAVFMSGAMHYFSKHSLWII